MNSKKKIFGIVVSVIAVLLTIYGSYVLPDEPRIVFGLAGVILGMGLTILLIGLAGDWKNPV